MPNYCDYEMKIKGSKEAIARVLACLNADYDYGEGKPAHKHFFRVFTAEEIGEPTENADGTFTQQVYGDCAWSVASCMLESAFSYYSVVKKDHPDIFMGTTLEEQSEDCEIEVFSEEPGMGFSEHYIFKNGKCVCDEQEQISSAGYDKKGRVTEKIDWDTYDGEIVMLNVYRKNEIGEFLWNL